MWVIGVVPEAKDEKAALRQSIFRSKCGGVIKKRGYGESYPNSRSSIDHTLLGSSRGGAASEPLVSVAGRVVPEIE